MHAEARLPGAQAPVDVLVGHRVALVEQADPLDQLAAHVHARACDRQRGAGAPGRTPAGGLEAVAVVEPLGRVAVAHRAAELDATVGILQLGADDADVLVAVSGVLQTLEPASAAPRCRSSGRRRRARRRSRAGRGWCSRRSRRSPRRRSARRCPSSRSQRRHVLGAAAVIGDDHAGHPRAAPSSRCSARASQDAAASR